jgi:hypothetical protein
MNYTEFKKHILKKNIHLFDAYSRIVYSKLFNTGSQIGGSTMMNFKKIIKKLDSTYLKILFESVYNDNHIRINYIIKNYI